MESIQQIKSRIASIESTRQITQSMRLVATSKITRVRAKMEKNREFFLESQALATLAANGVLGSRNRYVRTDGAGAIVVVIGSDRGLCGGYNVGVCREALALIRGLGDVKIATVGAKPRDYFHRRRKDALARSFTSVSENPFFEDATEIAELILSWYNSDRPAALYVVSSKFQNMLVREPVVKKLLPLESDRGAGEASTHLDPGGEALLHRIVPFYVASYLYGAMLESSVCEQSARVTTMDKAVKNSDEIIAKLTTQYNQARQGAITQEIIEIVSGAEAVRHRD